MMPRQRFDVASPDRLRVTELKGDRAEMLSEQLQQANWKNEKHVPLIECPDTFAKGEFVEVTVTIGKEIAHPNTTEHHISWITLFYQPEGDKSTYDLAHVEFNAHGASVKGANEGPAYTHHVAKAQVKLDQAGKLYAMSYCNIHGLWQSEKAVSVS
jgi:superoxide reductase